MKAILAFPLYRLTVETATNNIMVDKDQCPFPLNSRIKTRFSPHEGLKKTAIGQFNYRKGIPTMFVTDEMLHKSFTFFRKKCSKAGFKVHGITVGGECKPSSKCDLNTLTWTSFYHENIKMNIEAIMSVKINENYRKTFGVNKLNIPE